MTYRELAVRILELEQEQQNLDVTVRIDSEYFPLYGFAITEETDVLDAGHPFLTVER